MQLSLAREFFQCVGRDLHAMGTGTKSANCSCPLARWRHKKGTDTRPSFIVRLGAGHSRAKCYAASCDWRGTLADLLLELQMLGAEDVDYKTAREILDREWEGLGVAIQVPDFDALDDPTVVFPEWLLASYPPALECPPAQAYLESRKRLLSPEVQKFLDLRWDSTRGRVCFPYRNSHGELVGMHGRDATGQSEVPYLAYRYQEQVNYHVMLGEEWVDPDRPVVVAESVFDLAAVLPLYRNVVTPRSASMNEAMLETLAGWFHLVLLFDGDRDGEKAADKLLCRRRNNRITQVIPLPPGEDADSWGPERLRPMLVEALRWHGGLDDPLT